MNAKDLGLPEGVTVIHLGSPTFCEELEQALGFPLRDVGEVLTPQFARTDKVTVDLTLMPRTWQEWVGLCEKSPEQLKAAGCGVWNKNLAGDTHWLFPKEWYPHIPAGLPVLCIGGETKLFTPGVTDDDYRFGCLSYGFVMKNKTAPE